MLLDCYNILKVIEPRPEMFIGENTLKGIRTYITGYYQALLDTGVVTAAHTDEPFFDWITYKLGYPKSTAGWVDMIVAKSMGFNPEYIVWEEVYNTSITKEQHSHSIDRFYMLLEEFKTEMESEKRAK